jgi:hypothetical protein
MKIASNKAPRSERSHCRLTLAKKTKGKGTKKRKSNAKMLVNKIAITNMIETKKNLTLGSRS